MRVMVLRMHLEVSVQIIDPLGQKCNLNLRRTCVTLVTSICLDDFFFSSFVIAIFLFPPFYYVKCQQPG